ncbi:MAG: DUF1566 domain-containing protein [Candidatus Binatia bacterium]
MCDGVVGIVALMLVAGIGSARAQLPIDPVQEFCEQVGACPTASSPATGQTTSYASGDDGDVEAGAALSYTDNGDGTITDDNTGLMWEKKDSLGAPPNGGPRNPLNPHDADNCYSWLGSCSVGGAACGTDAECPGGTCNGTDCQCNGTDCQGPGLTIYEWVAQLNASRFAGHDDWRIPNVKELQSIVDYGRNFPAVDPAFENNCTSGCNLESCSCTARSTYGSSTSLAFFPGLALEVDFNSGFVVPAGKGGNFTAVRAVRGGSQ